MTINTTKITVVAVFLIICGNTVSRVMGQQTTALKNQPLAVIRYDGEMAYLLAQLTQRFDVTIGVETDPKHPKSPVSLYLREATLTDVLNAIVKSAPSYEWRERSGCIEVLPVGAGNPLLDTMISSFHVSDVSQTEAVNRLMNLSDVQANLKAMSLTRNDTGSASSERKSEKFSLNLEGVTMRQALSKIANESGGRFWILQTLDNGSFSISQSPR